ncbi:unnamed protein product [Durusdinium trenchii]|uniref:Uncharacterized protein n=2 Tax=Durusdinium trenchii TaxID=1381693 RepID=A0ABP0NLU0_9DINO
MDCSSGMAKRAAYPLEGISSAPVAVTHVRSLTMTSLRRTQEPPANGGSSGREATLRSVRSELKSAAQFCAQHRLDQVSGKVRPRQGSDTPRSRVQENVEDPQGARSPEQKNQTSGAATLQSNGVLSASKSLRGQNPRLRNGTGTRLFQQREPSNAAEKARGASPPSASPRVTAAHSPKRKPSASLVVQVRPRSGSFSHGAGALISTGAGAMTSPGRKATVRQTSAGAAVRKRSGPTVTAATLEIPVPLVEEEYAAGTSQAVLTAAFDESNAVMSFEEAEEWAVRRKAPLRMQIWWRRGGPSVCVSGMHENPITSMALCHGVRTQSSETTTSDTANSTGAEMEWLATSGRRQVFVWRLDRLQKAVNETLAAQESGEDLGPLQEFVRAITPEGVVALPQAKMSKCCASVWTYAGRQPVPPEGSVQCRSSPRGHCVVASTRDPQNLGQVVVYLVTKQMEVVKLQIMGWSDPLCDLVIGDIVPPAPDCRLSSDRVVVWFSGVGAKLYSFEVSCREKEQPRRLVSHVNLLPNNPVSCLSGSAKGLCRCYVGCKMATVQIMEWPDDAVSKANHLGKIQIPGCKSTASTGGLLQISWMPEETNILCIASVKCDDRRASKPLSNIAAKETKDAMKETRRPSLTNERGSPMTTPRGGTVRRKPLNGAGGFTRPVSSRGESNTGTPATVEGRKESRRMVSGPAARGGKTIPMARTLKRNPRFPNKVSTLDEVIPTTSEGELQARIERVPSPATQRHRSVEASHVPSARNSQDGTPVVEEEWAAKVARYQQHQTWAPAPGSSTPLWRLQANPLGHTTSNSISYVAAARTVQNAPNAYPSSHSATAAPQSIQGLSSWPTVWVPQAVPATPLTRHSMGQTLISGAVNAPVNAQAVIHRVPAGPQAFLHRWPFP